MLVEGNTSFDLTSNLNPQQMMQQLQISGAKLKLYTAEKKYDGDRKKEIFGWMERGALISKDGMLFKTLSNLK